MKNIICILAALSAFACAKQETEQSKRGVYINNVNRTPIELFKQYDSCEGDEAISDSSFYFLTQFLDGGPYGRNVDMSRALSGGQLRGFGIEETFYDAEMMLERRARGGVLVGLEFSVTNTPKALGICPGIKSYERYSYENAGMSAVYGISKTVEKLREVGFSAGRPVKVYVSPYTIERRIVELDDRVVQEDLRITDNAYYFPHLMAVVFMPQSEESRDGAGFGNAPLWEVPMVGAHEYGHHVFHSIMKSARGQLADHHHSCFSPEVKSLNSFVPRRVGVADALAAINEGVADIISYYSLDPEERGLEGVVCMELSREVGSPVFANNEPKEFSRRVMNSFFSERQEESLGCYVPNYQHIHIFGAVLASVADQMFDGFGYGKSSKLKLVVDWLRSLNRFHPNMATLSPEQYFTRAFALLAAGAMESSLMDSESACQLVEKHMPDSDYALGELEALGCR